MVLQEEKFVLEVDVVVVQEAEAECVFIYNSDLLVLHNNLTCYLFTGTFIYGYLCK